MMVKERLSSSAGSPSVRMAAMMSCGLAGPADPLAALNRATTRAPNRAARYCMAASRSSSLVPK
jgi:hypothetical protein